MRQLTATSLLVLCGLFQSAYSDTILTSTSLTAYELQDLYIWKIGGSAGENRQAVIRAPDGRLHIVGLSSTIGKNHGEIIDIKEQSIILKEIFQDGHGGFYEKNSVLDRISWSGFLADAGDCPRNIDPDMDRPPKCWWVVEESVAKIEDGARMEIEESIKEFQNNIKDEVVREEVISMRKRFNIIYRNDWNELKNMLREGDSIWRYESPGWRSLSGESGYVLVRDGEPIMHVRLGIS